MPDQRSPNADDAPVPDLPQGLPTPPNTGEMPPPRLPSPPEDDSGSPQPDPAPDIAAVPGP
ncbi:hypothetical protein WYO_4285 [Methylobacterium sp. GXF4]|uniref:Uncharacterized protein n=1 Tax=Methylobacterium brachiatum TaxID=269660 RepID=A0ABV1R6E2_9HYPH|nr:hypothetical protein [Methylobacterium sp. GXF4]EIZ82992.1 hypothetical protein WYO_4285 [Methylobacterium sp. GXF4]